MDLLQPVVAQSREHESTDLLARELKISEEGKQRQCVA